MSAWRQIGGLMLIIAYISAGALVLFTAGYVGRMIHLRLGQHINANAVGQSGKPAPVRVVEWLVWFLTLLFIFIWVASFIYWPKNVSDWPNIYRSLLLPLFQQSDSANALLLVFPILGVLLTWLGSVLFIAAVLNMGSAWRVGIDTKSNGHLVTDGLFAFSRNPIYVGFRLLYTGVWLTFPGVTLGLVVFMVILFLHMLTLYEEAFLLQKFGTAYSDYCNKTPRYLLPSVNALLQSRRQEEQR